MKSFEEKIREIEAARNKELAELNNKHEEKIRGLKEALEVKASENASKVIEQCVKAKLIITKAGMKPVDDYINKKIGSCENEIQ